MPKPKTKANQTTRDFLLRNLPLDVAERLKVAASLHRTPMKDYIQTVLEAHLKELERKGITLSLPKGSSPVNARSPYLIVSLLLLTFLSPVPTWADFQAGIDAYNRGDYATALREWQPLAEQGDARAQLELGFLYHFGYGVPQDYTKARQWYERAAAQGDARAQLNLGALYDNGQGAPQDYVLAYMWFNLAAPHLTGDEQKLASDNRNKVARRMTPAQIAEAQKLAREWKLKTPSAPR